MPADAAEATLSARDPDYMLTVDADSILLPEYCICLVHILEPQVAPTAALDGGH